MVRATRCLWAKVGIWWSADWLTGKGLTWSLSRVSCPVSLSRGAGNKGTSSIKPLSHESSGWGENKGTDGTDTKHFGRQKSQGIMTDSSPRLEDCGDNSHPRGPERSVPELKPSESQKGTHSVAEAHTRDSLSLLVYKTLDSLSVPRHHSCPQC